MATNKKSFILYCDLIHVVKKLSLDQAGKLFIHILEYVNDLNPETDDPLIDIVFEPIKHTLKRDLNKWENQRVKNQSNANMRWHKKDATACDRMRPDANHAVSVSVNDTVNDSVNELKKETSFFLELKELEKELLTSDQWHEHLSKNLNQKIPFIKKQISEYIKTLQNRDEAGKDFKQAKSHFANWLNKELEKKQPAKEITPGYFRKLSDDK